MDIPYQFSQFSEGSKNLKLTSPHLPEIGTKEKVMCRPVYYME